MNKKYFVLIALLSVFLLPGCGQVEAGAVQSEPQDEVLAVQRPEREPDMMGMVSNMVGNQVTILLFSEEDMSFGGMQRPDGNEGQDQSGAQDPGGSGFNPTQALGSTGGRMPGMGSGMGRGMRADGQEGEFDREAMEEMRNQMIKELKEKSIGTETIMIPVGIPIVGGGGPPQDGESRGENQIDFSEIQKDSMITVWLNQDVEDKKVAEFVAVMGGGFGGNRNFNGGAESQN